MFENIDHLLIVVENLEAAVEDYQLLLGRECCWLGDNPEHGFENAIFRLSNSYIELLAPNAEGGFADVLRGHLQAKGPGLIGMAFATRNLKHCHQALKDRGVHLGEIEQGEAVCKRSGESRRWTMAQIPSEFSRGIFCFAVQHQDPLALPLSKRLVGLSGAESAESLDHVVISSADGDAFVAQFQQGLGLSLKLDKHRPEWGLRQLFFRIGSNILEVVCPLEDDKKPSQDDFWGLAIQVPDIDLCHERLSTASVIVSDVRKGRKPGTEVATVKSHNLGIDTLLIASV